MKLITKLTVFYTVSKLAIVLLFVSLLPSLVNNIVSTYTNNYLRQQKEKVIAEIQQRGIDYYLQGQPSYGSYTMLKDEYVSLEPNLNKLFRDTIETSLRVVEEDTLSYRVLREVFDVGPQTYVLEVARTTATIGQLSQPLQKVALSVLAGLIGLTIILDLAYTRIVLKPLKTIISSRIVNAKFPFREPAMPVKTTTSDFLYLDTCLADLMQKVKHAFDKEREFTSNASHELMTPVSILQNKLENMMVDGGISDGTQEKIQGMMNTLNRLKKIVRALLLISRIENDQYSKTETIGISTLIAEVMDELADRVDARGLKVEINIKKDIEISGVNHDLVFQLFYNLINNAIRYNKEGGSIRINADKAARGCMVSVEDSGIGIPQQELYSIFNRFKKSHRSAEEGYGLGLSIIKSIADYHSITIQVDSTVGKGSAFRVKFQN